MTGVYVAELEYDIQEMFIEGYEPDEIAHKLKLSLGKVVSILNEFGVRTEDLS
jgi:DNA-binding CsgD family transcriptional regulator|tara:strand:+ start:1088 stop:1246 length:159 start_codon:yes stop_codon:yes gene_type:complete